MALFLHSLPVPTLATLATLYAAVLAILAVLLFFQALFSAALNAPPSHATVEAT